MVEGRNKLEMPALVEQSGGGGGATYYLRLSMKHQTKIPGIACPKVSSINL
jgi:hypothetical protein